MNINELKKDLENGAVFDIGEPNPFGKFFDGQSYLKMLASSGIGI